MTNALTVNGQAVAVAPRLSLRLRLKMWLWKLLTRGRRKRWNAHSDACGPCTRTMKRGRPPHMLCKEGRALFGAAVGVRIKKPGRDMRRGGWRP